MKFYNSSSTEAIERFPRRCVLSTKDGKKFTEKKKFRKESYYLKWLNNDADGVLSKSEISLKVQHAGEITCNKRFQGESNPGPREREC